MLVKVVEAIGRTSNTIALDLLAWPPNASVQVRAPIIRGGEAADHSALVDCNASLGGSPYASGGVTSSKGTCPRPTTNVRIVSKPV